MAKTDLEKTAMMEPVGPEKRQETAPTPQELTELDASPREEATYTKHGNAYVVADGRGDYGQYANIEWSERDGCFDVQVYAKFEYFDYEVGDYVADANPIWGSYMLEGKAHENDRSDYGATADGRITTVEGLQKALGQFDISWPKGLSDEIEAIAGVEREDKNYQPDFLAGVWSGTGIVISSAARLLTKAMSMIKGKVGSKRED